MIVQATEPWASATTRFCGGMPTPGASATASCTVRVDSSSRILKLTASGRWANQRSACSRPRRSVPTTGPQRVQRYVIACGSDPLIWMISSYSSNDT